MRENAGQKVVRAYQDWDFYFTKRDKLRVEQDGKIYSMGTLIGYFEDEEDLDGEYQQFLVLTMQNFKSQPSWKTHKLQLAHAANDAGLRVIFVPQIDIGFGLFRLAPEQDGYCPPIQPVTLFGDLIQVAKYSQDSDIRTACCAIVPGYGQQYDEIVAYSYNQEVDGEFLHAENVVLKYCKVHKGWVERFVMLLEPCSHCLNGMVEAGAEDIVFGMTHKSKWNTNEYIQLTNDIHSKTKLSYRGRPIRFRRVCTNKVEAFYKPKEGK